MPRQRINQTALTVLMLSSQLITLPLSSSERCLAKFAAFAALFPPACYCPPQRLPVDLPPGLVPCWVMLSQATQVKAFPRLDKVSRGRVGSGNGTGEPFIILYRLSHLHCLGGKFALGWYCGYLPVHTSMLKDVGCTRWACVSVGKLCSIWQDCSKSRCRFTVLVPSKLTGICRETFLIL